MIPESGNLPAAGTESAASCGGFRSRGIDCTVSALFAQGLFAMLSARLEGKHFL